MGRREETVSQYSVKVRRVKDVWGVRKFAKAGTSCQLLLDYELLLLAFSVRVWSM